MTEDYTRLIAVAGVIIALAAAVTTIWQGVLMRRHSRLSVAPLLRIDRVFVPGEPLLVLLKNNGLGPAIIGSMRFFVDGQSLESCAEAVNLLRSGGSKYNQNVFRTNETIAAGESHVIIESQGVLQTSDNAKEMKRIFRRLSIVIEYQSIYRQKFLLKEVAMDLND